MRKTKKLVITAEGRDKGKTFLLTEMPAVQAEKWAIRAMLALTRSGVEVPEEVSSMGMAAIAAIGLRAFGNIVFMEAEPLLDEMMTCAAFVPDPSKPAVTIEYPLFLGQVEEVATLLLLRSEVVALHTGFSIADALSKSRTSATDRKREPTPTSPSPSA